MSVDKEELGFSLFHGTSSIFLDSINQLGLGGENVSEKYQINAMFSQIVDAFNCKYKDSNWWVCSGQLKLATVLELFQYRRSDSFGVSPPLY